MQTSLRICEEIRSVNKTLRRYHPGELFFPSQVKAERHRVASSTGLLSNEMHKSFTVNNLFPEGMNVSYR